MCQLASDALSTQCVYTETFTNLNNNKYTRSFWNKPVCVCVTSFSTSNIVNIRWGWVRQKHTQRWFYFKFKCTWVVGGGEGGFDQTQTNRIPPTTSLLHTTIKLLYHNTLTQICSAILHLKSLKYGVCRRFPFHDVMCVMPMYFILISWWYISFWINKPVSMYFVFR